MRFILDHEGQNFWAKVIHKLLDCDAQDHHSIKLLLPLCDGELREIISCNKLLDLISKQHQTKLDGCNDLLGCNHNSDHHGHLKKPDPLYKGLLWNVHFHWDNGTSTWEPLSEITKMDPVSITLHGYDHDLLDKPRWCFSPVHYQASMFHQPPAFQCHQTVSLTSNPLKLWC